MSRTDPGAADTERDPQPPAPLPPDDPARHGVHVNPDTPGLTHISLVKFEVVWAGGGGEHSMFATTATQLVALTGGQLVDVAEVAAAAGAQRAGARRRGSAPRRPTCG